MASPSEGKVRGTLYASKDAMKAWGRAVAISHEDGRSESEARELMTKATALALEHYVARRAA